MNSTLKRYVATYGREYAASAIWADLFDAEAYGLRARARRLHRALELLGEE